MFKIFSRLIFILTLIGCSKYDEVKEKFRFAFPNYVRCNVVRVISGNIFDCQLQNIDMETIELIGVQIPPSFKSRASEFSESCLRRGLPVKLEFDEERYDGINIFAYVYLPGEKMLNALLIDEGYAEYNGRQSNVKYGEYLLSLQERAKEQRRGIWGEVK